MFLKMFEKRTVIKCYKKLYIEFLFDPKLTHIVSDGWKDYLKHSEATNQIQNPV